MNNKEKYTKKSFMNTIIDNDYLKAFKPEIMELSGKFIGDIFDTIDLIQKGELETGIEIHSYISFARRDIKEKIDNYLRDKYRDPNRRTFEIARRAFEHLILENILKEN